MSESPAPYLIACIVEAARSSELLCVDTSVLMHVYVCVCVCVWQVYFGGGSVVSEAGWCVEQH